MAIARDARASGRLKGCVGWEKPSLSSLSAAFNPTLLAALMVMLLSTNAKRLMFGYLLGA